MGGLTVAMPVRNEASRYLREVLTSVAAYADRIVVLDDQSTDDSPAVARSLGAEVYHTPESLFHDEWRLRTQLWELAGAGQPEWILSLDADEIFEPQVVRVMPFLLGHPELNWFGFPLYDLWNDRQHYRDDPLWTAHHLIWPLLVRYRPGFPYHFRRRAHHCGRLPENALVDPGAASPLKLLHLGWLDPADRQAKYDRYRRLDPEGKWGSLAQYESILDSAPQLSSLEGVSGWPG